MVFLLAVGSFYLIVVSVDLVPAMALDNRDLGQALACIAALRRVSDLNGDKQGGGIWMVLQLRR
jgi:hypothetical protein